MIKMLIVNLNSSYTLRFSSINQKSINCKINFAAFHCYQFQLRFSTNIFYIPRKKKKRRRGRRMTIHRLCSSDVLRWNTRARCMECLAGVCNRTVVMKCPNSEPCSESRRDRRNLQFFAGSRYNSCRPLLRLSQFSSCRFEKKCVFGLTWLWKIFVSFSLCIGILSMQAWQTVQ